jgi:uncharacterized protein (TIGR00255 family)
VRDVVKYPYNISEKERRPLMIRSMTGFGRAERDDGKRNITVEIRGVNHRYCDISVRMPRRYSFAEDKIKNAVKEKIKRGKIEVSVMVENITESDAEVRLNTMVARQYYDNLVLLSKEFNVSGDISLEYLASLPDVLKSVPDVEDEAEITEAVLIPVREAVDNMTAMRETEGRKLAADLLGRGKTVRELADKIEERAEKVPAIYMEKLRERISELIGSSIEVPEERILTEAAIFADKCSIAEELTRLRSHIDQMADIIEKASGPEGKKLDFLVQEMNREANTIGSKANDIEVTNLMLMVKAEVEKIREQVQNIE